MNQEQRIEAEQALQQFGNSIEIKDFGLAVVVMHRQLQRKEKTVNKLKSNVSPSSEVEKSCKHIWPIALGYVSCLKCGKFRDDKD